MASQIAVLELLPGFPGFPSILGAGAFLRPLKARYFLGRYFSGFFKKASRQSVLQKNHVCPA